MADLNDLAIFMDKLQGPVAVFGSAKAREIAEAILFDLVTTTPVDTGTALSNWKVSLDAPDENPIPAFAPSPKGKRVKGIWVHAVDPLATAQANIPFVLQNANRVLSTKQPGQVIFITNSVEYIQELNSGSSLQQPAGFVERAEVIGQQIAERAHIL